MEDLEKEKERVRDFVKKYCSFTGFHVNPDMNVAEVIITGLAKNKCERGARYCPCRIVTGNTEEDKGKICPCKWHKEEIERDGHCHCLLFFK